LSTVKLKISSDKTAKTAEFANFRRLREIMRKLTVSVIVLLIVVAAGFTHAVSAATAPSAKDVEKTVVGYMAGKVDVMIAWWVFDEKSLTSHNSDLLTVDRIAREQKTSLSALADKMRKDLISQFNDLKKGYSSPEIDPDAAVMSAMFRCIFEVPELVRPTPTECGVTEQQLRKHILGLESQYQAMEAQPAGTTADLFTFSCLRRSAENMDERQMKVLLADDDTIRFVMSRANRSEFARKIYWLWEQYRKGYLPKGTS
jgi:hypothetical protein